MAFFSTHGFAIVLAVPLLYLDPGSGSFILQLVLAALVGGLLLVKIYFKKIKAFFTKSSNRPSDSNDTDEPRS